MRLETILDGMGDALILWVEDGNEKHLRQYRAFRARILKMDAEKDKLIRTAAELEYHNQVVATGMEDEMIGGDNYEYADKEDWIESWLYGLKIWMNDINE